METDAAVGVGAGVAVFEVAADGTSHVCQLTAYLVMPTRMEFHFQQVVAAGGGGEEAVVEDGKFWS